MELNGKLNFYGTLMGLFKIRYFYFCAANKIRDSFNSIIIPEELLTHIPQQKASNPH